MLKIIMKSVYRKLLISVISQMIQLNILLWVMNDCTTRNIRLLMSSLYSRQPSIRISSSEATSDVLIFVFLMSLKVS